MRNEACFIYVINGQSTLFGPQESMEFNTDDGVVMKCGSYMNIWKKGASDELYHAVAVHFHPDIVRLVYLDELPQNFRPAEKAGAVNIQKVAVDQMTLIYLINDSEL